MSRILNKIFDKDLYNTVKAERYELDYSGNKVMYNIEQLEGLAEQGNEEAKAIVDKVNSEVNEMLKKTNTTYAPWHVLESNDKKYATKIKKTYHKCVIIRGMKERQSEGYS